MRDHTHAGCVIWGLSVAKRPAGRPIIVRLVESFNIFCWRLFGFRWVHRDSVFWAESRPSVVRPIGRVVSGSGCATLGAVATLHKARAKALSLRSAHRYFQIGCARRACASSHGAGESRPRWVRDSPAPRLHASALPPRRRFENIFFRLSRCIVPRIGVFQIKPYCGAVALIGLII